MSNIDEYGEIIEKDNNSVRKRGKNKIKYILFFLIWLIVLGMYLTSNKQIFNKNKNANLEETIKEEETLKKTYTLGDTGPAGGIVFYGKGSYSDGWRYLETAPASTEWRKKEWGGYKIKMGGTETDIGSGQSNTTRIVKWLNNHSEAGKAAQLCDALVVENNGVTYSDWFLPSKDELYLILEMYLPKGWEKCLTFTFFV